MNKFLRLVEENRPGSDKYTVELKDFNGEVVDTFDMYGTESPFDAFGDFQKFIHDQFSKFKEEWGAPSSDEEGVLDDKEKEALALGREFSKGGQKRIFGKDPEKAVGKAYGDALLKVASKIEDIVR